MCRNHLLVSVSNRFSGWQSAPASLLPSVVLTESDARKQWIVAVGKIEDDAYRTGGRRGGRGRRRCGRGVRRPSRQGRGGRRCHGGGTALPPRPPRPLEASCPLHPPRAGSERSSCTRRLADSGWTWIWARTGTAEMGRREGTERQKKKKDAGCRCP